jgi:hypothetical protein
VLSNLCYAVLHNNWYTLFLENFISAPFILYIYPCRNFWTSPYAIAVLFSGFVQPNQHLNITQSVQCIRCGSAWRKTTERRVRLVNTPATNSEIPGFISRSGERLSVLRFSWFSSDPPGEFWDSTLKLCHYRLFPKILYISSFTYHPFIRRYIVCVTEKAPLTKLQVKVNKKSKKISERDSTDSAALHSRSQKHWTFAVCWYFAPVYKAYETTFTFPIRLHGLMIK